MYENSGDVTLEGVGVLAKQTSGFVQKFGHELLDLVGIRVGRVFCLLEEVDGGVLDWFHQGEI